MQVMNTLRDFGMQPSELEVRDLHKRCSTCHSAVNLHLERAVREDETSQAKSDKLVRLIPELTIEARIVEIIRCCDPSQEEYYIMLLKKTFVNRESYFLAKVQDRYKDHASYPSMIADPVPNITASASSDPVPNITASTSSTLPPVAPAMAASQAPSISSKAAQSSPIGISSPVPPEQSFQQVSFSKSIALLAPQAGPEERPIILQMTDTLRDLRGLVTLSLGLQDPALLVMENEATGIVIDSDRVREH